MATTIERSQTERDAKSAETEALNRGLCLVEVHGNLKVVVSEALREEAARAAGRVPLPNLEKKENSGPAK